MKKLLFVAALIASTNASAGVYKVCIGETNENCRWVNIVDKPVTPIAVATVQCTGEGTPCVPQHVTGEGAVKLGNFFKSLFGNRTYVDDTERYMKAGQ